jgi:hypothetical protein
VVSVVLLSIVSKVMPPPAFRLASPPADTVAPRLVMSLAASSDRLPVAVMPAVLPMSVT